jgi:hypothetical protein
MATAVQFPENKKFSKSKIHQILQIEFSIKPQKSLNSGLADVWSFNNLLQSSVDNPYYWRSIPATYTAYLRRAFFRLELLKHTVVNGKGNLHLKHHVQRHLVHLDMTLDQVWEEARIAIHNNQMTKDWRSPTMDQWLLIEYYVQRHNSFDVENFREEEPGNPDRLKADPFELSKHFIVLEFLHISINMYLDWFYFDNTVPEWLGGKIYDWSIVKMRGDCDMSVVTEYYLAFFGMDDEEAAAILNRTRQSWVY